MLKICISDKAIVVGLCQCTLLKFGENCFIHEKTSSVFKSNMITAAIMDVGNLHF